MFNMTYNNYKKNANMYRQEFTINTFLDQQEKLRYQLIQINVYAGSKSTVTYQIRKNRKILGNYKWEGDAKKQFYIHIGNELLQTKLL